MRDWQQLTGFVLATSWCVACGSGKDTQNTPVDSVGGNTSVKSGTGGMTGTHTTTVLGGFTSTGGRQSSASSSALHTGGSSALHAGGTSALGGSSHSGGTRVDTGGTKGTGGSTSVGGSTIAISNELDAIVEQGTTLGYVNGLFVNVTLCVPGTTNCQTIDHVLVDTGSYGLRILESAINLQLPTVTNSAGATLAECAQFVSGTAWGPLARADVKLGEQTAAGITIQTIGIGKYPMPNAATCTGEVLNDAASLRSNGILGVGFYQQDCGAACASASTNPGIYMACTSTQTGGCKTATAPLELQVSNPIVSFSTNNNGLIIQLPDVPEQGAQSVTGKLVFGLGTQSNNGLGSATVFTPVDQYGNIGTSFPVGGTQYAAFLDSGSNAIYFLNAATSGLAACPSRYAGFYCPPSTTSLSATIFGARGASAAIDFKVANVSQLDNAMSAFNNVAGEMPGYPSTNPGSVDFIWGLSFFFGRKIFTAIERQSTPAGTGPYVAF